MQEGKGRCKTGTGRTQGTMVIIDAVVVGKLWGLHLMGEIKYHSKMSGKTINIFLKSMLYF